MFLLSDSLCLFGFFLEEVIFSEEKTEAQMQQTVETRSYILYNQVLLIPQIILVRFHSL